jgi:predicted ArsR family transcriptional regulator
LIDLPPDTKQPPTRQKIILALKHHGALTAAALGDLLGMPSMGARCHHDTLTQHNCPEYDVAAMFGAACSSELGFLHAIVPDAEVTHERFPVGRKQSCVYRISCRDEAPI